jgi:hypothetical protein
MQPWTQAEHPAALHSMLAYCWCSQPVPVMLAGPSPHHAHERCSTNDNRRRLASDLQARHLNRFWCAVLGPAARARTVSRASSTGARPWAGRSASRAGSASTSRLNSAAFAARSASDAGCAAVMAPSCRFWRRNHVLVVQSRRAD